jgi:hypothetical protein
VKIVTPITHSVLRREHPRSKIWSGPIDITAPSYCVRLPSNLYKNSFGASQSTSAPLKFLKHSCSVFASLITFLSAYLCFKFVSPSRFFVSTKQTPFLRDELRIYISQGKNSSSITLTIYPTLISSALLRTNYSAPTGNIKVYLLFSSASDLWRFLSSKKSLSIETPHIKATLRNVVNQPPD